MFWWNSPGVPQVSWITTIIKYIADTSYMYVSIPYKQPVTTTPYIYGWRIRDLNLMWIQPLRFLALNLLCP